jgi:hypothetical protein
MKTSTTTTRRHLLRRIALGFAIAALAAPTAQAATSDPPEAGHSAGPSLTTIPAELSGRQFGPTTAAVVSDALPGLVEGRQYGPSTLPLVAIPDSLSGRQFGPTTGESIPVVPVATPADGFGWGDAGIGAGIAVALGLLAMGTLRLTRRQTDPARA